jgi:hypothetical protein
LNKNALHAVTLVGLSVTAGFADTLTVVSDTNTKYTNQYVDTTLNNVYPVTPAVGLPAGWNMVSFDDSGWRAASLCQLSAWMDPTHTSPFSGNGARWISENGTCDQFDGIVRDYFWQDGQRGVYLFRRRFSAPGTALNLTATVALGADNYGFVYLNGAEILRSAHMGMDDAGDNLSPTAGPATATVNVPTLACQNVIGVEVQNGGSVMVTNSAMGAVFSVIFTYQKPLVAWTNPSPGELIKGGNIAIKFDLTTPTGTALTAQGTVALAIFGPSSPGSLGPLLTNVAAADVNFNHGTYTARIPVRNYPFQSGATYTAVVQDSCNSDVIGTVEFVVK